MVIQDEIDEKLDKEDGMIKRSRDPALCRHSAHSKCQNCLPIDPFDEEYLQKREIKHMSFHAYLRKLRGFKKSALNRYPLENVSCKIKPGCLNHKPWPNGICDKCRPSDITLNRQRYRHVDNIAFENDHLVSRFIDFWRHSGYQRIGYLLGYYEPHLDVPLGIRAVVAAIYEPVQIAPHRNVVQLMDFGSELDPEDAVAFKLASQLGLQPVGWIFTDLMSDPSRPGAVACTRSIDSYFLSAEECVTAGYLQSKHPNPTKYSLDGYFGSKFTTVVVTGDSSSQVQVFGYQVSNQCSALVADNCLIPTKDAPELAYVRESSSLKYVPNANYMAKDEYNNEVQKVGRPLPVEYLIVDVPASMPKDQRFTFTADPSRISFPVEHREVMGQCQDLPTITAYCRQFSPEKLIDMVSDYHFILYLLNNKALGFTADMVNDLCVAIRQKDKVAVTDWAQNCSQWTAFSHLLSGHDIPNSSDTNAVTDSSTGWPCYHCTFVNKDTNHDCEVCGLPKQ